MDGVVVLEFQVVVDQLIMLVVVDLVDVQGWVVYCYFQWCCSFGMQCGGYYVEMYLFIVDVVFVGIEFGQ